MFGLSFGLCVFRQSLHAGKAATLRLRVSPLFLYYSAPYYSPVPGVALTWTRELLSDSLVDPSPNLPAPRAKLNCAIDRLLFSTYSNDRHADHRGSGCFLSTQLAVQIITLTDSYLVTYIIGSSPSPSACDDSLPEYGVHNEPLHRLLPHIGALVDSCTCALGLSNYPCIAPLALERRSTCVKLQRQNNLPRMQLLILKQSTASQCFTQLSDSSIYHYPRTYL